MDFGTRRKQLTDGENGGPGHRNGGVNLCRKGVNLAVSVIFRVSGERDATEQTAARATACGFLRASLRFLGFRLSPLAQEGDGDLLGGK